MTCPPCTDGREGLIVSSTHPIIADLNVLAAKHNLIGVVLVGFDLATERVFTTVGGTNAEFVERGMKPLANKILARIDDGDFDPDDRLVRACEGLIP